MDSTGFFLASPETLVLILSAGFVAAYVSGIGGFGGSFILAAALTTVTGPKAVVPLIAVYALFANLGRVYIYRKDIHWNFVIRFILASLPGLWLGAQFLKWVPETYLMLLFGLLLIGALPLRRRLKQIQSEPHWGTLAAIGFIFGAVSGTAVGSGMFVIAALNTIGLHGAALLGTDAAIGIANSASRIITFAALGLLDRGTVLVGGLLGAVSIPATWMASLTVRKMGREIHAWIIEAIILCAGLFFLVSAIAMLLYPG